MAKLKQFLTDSKKIYHAMERITMITIAIAFVLGLIVLIKGLLILAYNVMFNF